MITCILVPLVLLLFYSGRLHIVKGKLQNATDAVALAAAAKIREQGLTQDGRVELDQATVSQVVRAHLPAKAVNGQLRVVSSGDSPDVVVRVDLRVSVDVPFGQGRTFEAVSHARVRQRLIARRWPAVVIAADVSPSMAGENFRLLREMLLRYAGLGLPVRNGLLLYNGGIKTRIDPPIPQMSNIEAFRSHIPASRPSGTGSNPLLAITTARSMLSPFTHPDTQRNFILISDGGVNRGSWQFWNIGSDIRTQARDLRYLPSQGVAVHSIFPNQAGVIDGATNWLQGQLTGAANMVREIAGGPESEGNDREFYTSVAGYGQIDAFLRKLTEWVCSYGPMDLERDDLLGVYLRRSTGEEQRLNRVTSYSSDQEGFRLRHTEVGDYIAVTRLTCYALGRNPENRLVLRWGPARLAGQPSGAQP
jgi:Flp pilus assembly protein TadG